MLDVKLKELIEIWNNNPRITRSDLMKRLETDGQNVKRWMKSAGLHEFPDDDGELRYKPIWGVAIKTITEKPEEGLTEKQRTAFYIGLGYDDYSIAVHQNVLLATIMERRSSFHISVAQPKDSEDQSEIAEQEMQAVLEIPFETPEEAENRVYEHNQHKDRFVERGDAPLPHVGEIIENMFFPNGVPKCQPCQRSILYTDLVLHYNSQFPKYPESPIHVDAGDKIVFPWPVAKSHVETWGRWRKFPTTGYPHIDDLRLAQAFWEDSMHNFISKRIGWIYAELAAGRYSGDRK